MCRLTSCTQAPRASDALHPAPSAADVGRGPVRVAVTPSFDPGGGADAGSALVPGAIDADAERAELRALIERCARGDGRAFETLYGRVASRLLGCLLRILRDRDRAEEALQDVFVQIWQRARQYDASRGEPLTWLISMARYRAIDLVRAKRPVRAFEEGELESLAGPQSADPADGLALAHSASLLDRCLGRLTAEQRRCLELAFCNGLSHDEVAASVNSPLGTVKSWIRRGLQSLRECMDS
jgi:RNA polymerase sigma-70 factor, ECF subfamily